MIAVFLLERLPAGLAEPRSPCAPMDFPVLEVVATPTEAPPQQLWPGDGEAGEGSSLLLRDFQRQPAFLLGSTFLGLTPATHQNLHLQSCPGLAEAKRSWMFGEVSF